MNCLRSPTTHLKGRGVDCREFPWFSSEAEEESICASGTINLIEFNGQYKQHLIGISVKGSRRPQFYVRSIEQVQSQGVEGRDNSLSREEVAREEVPSRTTIGEE